MSVIFVNIKTCPWPWTMTVWGHKPSQGDEGPAQQLGFKGVTGTMGKFSDTDLWLSRWPRRIHQEKSPQNMSCVHVSSWSKLRQAICHLYSFIMLRNCTLLILTTSTGWWFGTYCCIFPYIGNNFPIVLLPHTLGTITPTDFHIFQRGSDH